MKQCKLIVHNKDFSEEDLVLNPKDFPDVHHKDVIEIYQPEGKFSRLLLKVSSLRDDFPQKDTISVDQNIATNFSLRTFADVIVNVVDPKTVALDSLELTFKDQYLERGDMWRLRRNLETSCVYLNKKIEFCGIRCQVYEMWAQGERVACGVVADNTKIVFRSSTSLVYLFIQMSSEMWDVDINGDLYFEKAINGFFADLFAKWKENACSHEVTIVLFSRWFYEAQNQEEFPPSMRACIEQDYRGRFYEDFYSVAVQNERYEDWAVILVVLKRLFNNYRESVLQFHHRPGITVPQAVNSTAAQGNFLEVLNMSLNVFEKHYLDRSFDRTGHLSVVITPGVGVFEVDRELTNLTKQRIIDNGVGSDLVCLGEQPLHAVPLFKFHSKSPSSSVDDYSMPHWINLSRWVNPNHGFYSSSKQASYSSFIPRIKIPPLKTKVPKEKAKNSDIIQPRAKPVEQDFPPLMDYDEYDAQVFKHAVPGANNARQSSSLQRAMQHHKKSEATQFHHTQPRIVPRVKKFSESDLGFMQSDTSKTLSRSAAITIPQRNMDFSPLSSSLNILSPDGGRLTPNSMVESCDDEVSSPVRPIVGSAGSPYTFPSMGSNAVRPGRALINPFDPSHVTIKLTSNRRRWTHVFPLGPTGIFMQQHHYQAVPHSSSGHTEDLEVGESVLESYNTMEGPEPRRRKTSSVSMYPAMDASNRSKGTPSRSSVHTPIRQTETSLTLLWGATGEQEWTPALTTGVDWKSLTIPACLPLTTDYFPDGRSLKNDYLFSGYDLIPDTMISETTRNRNSSYKPLTPIEVFQELVCQRLVQGFQLIVNPRTSKFEAVPKQANSTSGSHSLRRLPISTPEDEHKEEYFLSIGRIFHKVALIGGTIKTTCHKPRHPYPTIKIDYRYRFKAPYSDGYEVSWVEFTSEKLENFNWNYLDHYICTHGESDFSLNESMKYMRFRMFLLPVRSKVVIEGESARYDVYDELTVEEEAQLTDGFIKFLEVLNKIRKSAIARKTRDRAGTLSKLTSGPRRPSQNSQPISVPAHPIGAGALLPFRDRTDNTRGMERPRAPTASKAIERVRSESGNGGRGVLVSQTSLGGESKTISSSSMSLDSGTDSMTGIQKDGAEDGSSPATTPRRLTLSSSLEDIVEAMKHPQDGLNFVNNPTGLPNMTFVGAEATSWIMEHLEGSSNIDKAISVLENLQINDFICHCSTDPSHPFYHGFYLYYISPYDKEFQSDGYTYSSRDVEQFQKEWLEVAFHQHRHGGFQSMSGPYFLRPDLEMPSDLDSGQPVRQGSGKRPSAKYKIPLFKTANMDIASSTKSNRDEWGHVRYHGHYNPGEAFEFVLQWLVATGSIVTELVHQNLARRAASFGFSLLPLPGDPFALPFSYQSDPLRGPIFIPLSVECLTDDGSTNLFGVFPRHTREYRMFLFQEAIAKRFGFFATQANRFLTDAASPDGSSQHSSGGGGQSLGQQHQPHYVHATGNMFLMALIQLQQIITDMSQKDFAVVAKTLQAGLENVASSPHEEYITRHIMGRSRRKSLHLDEQDCRIGFLWSWNYMLSKRWKLGITGDETFMSKILNDFRSFCANKDNRLKSFWDNSKEELNRAEAKKQELENK